jgi:release factor glutamine methyltransferase
MFKSSLSKDFEETVRKRHEFIIKDFSKNKSKKTYNIEGIKIKVHKGTFPPFDDSVAFFKVLKKIKKPGSVLELGTGSGILIFAVANRADFVIATDINKAAINSAKENVKINKTKNVKIVYSDLFSNVQGKFDTIIFNPPFGYFKPKNMLNRSIEDHNYKTLTKFFRQVRKHLKKTGKIYLIFSNSGYLKYLHYLIKKNKFKKKLLKKVKGEPLVANEKIFYYIYEIK